MSGILKSGCLQNILLGHCPQRKHVMESALKKKAQYTIKEFINYSSYYVLITPASSPAAPSVRNRTVAVPTLISEHLI